LRLKFGLISWILFTESPDGQPGTDEAVHQSASDRSGLEIATLAQFTPTEKTLKIPYYMLKPAAKNQHFIGRKDILRRIDELLLPTADLPAQESYGSPRVFAIHGLGGVGKTEVAREYALSRQQQFDAIFWVEADQTTQLSEGFSIIAAQLGFADSADQDRVVSRNITLEWLANPQISPGSRDSSLRSGQNACEYEARWLLIFNNADDLELLRIFWPLTQTGSILVTSRDPMVKRGRAGLELEPFETDEAATLLRTLTEFEDSPENREASTALAIRLGGLPLAITQIAALIDRWEMTLPEFLAHFDKQISIATMAKEKHENLPDSPYYKHSLLTVWALDSLIPEASAILQVLSFLSPDSIRESLLSATIPFTQAPASYPTLDEDFIRARSDLTKTSLVRRDRGEGKLVLHRLVQDVVRSQMDAIAIHSALGFSAQLILHAWPTSFLRFDHDIGTWDKSEELLPHILKLRDHFQTYLPGIESVEAKQNFAKLLLFAGWYLFERMDYDAAKPLFLAILGMPRDDSLRMDELRADALFALAALSTQINETKERTIAYAEQHLVYRRALRDGTRFREDRLAMAHGELAQAQLIAGEYEDAILNANIAIELTLPSPAFLNGDDWPTFAETHKAFALAALGRYADALDAIDRNLDYWMAHAHERYPFQ
jgi:tetratricopeptide (TPR) repeat protein